MKKIILITLLFLSSSAHAQMFKAGNGLMAIAPSGDFADVYAAGLSYMGRVELTSTPIVKPFVETGYASWGSAIDGIDEDFNSIFIGGGARLTIFGPLYAKVTAGYQLLDIQDFYYGPGLGIRLFDVDLSVTTNFATDTPFLGLELNYYWYK